MSQIQVTYDPRADAAYIYLVDPTGPGDACRTVQASPDINLDFDKEGRLIGIELLSGPLLHLTLARIAKVPGKEHGAP
jgi:uncharacterized protein YuzE